MAVIFDPTVNVDELRKVNTWLNEEIERLRAELSVAKEEIARLNGLNTFLNEHCDAAWDKVDEQDYQLAQRDLVIQQMQGLIKQLVDVSPRSLGRCSGYKCREPYCVSCNDEQEAEEYLQGVFDLCHGANKAIALKASTEYLDAWFKEQIGEPVAYRCDWNSDEGAIIDWRQYHDADDPLPELWDDDKPSITPLYAIKEKS